MRITNLYLLFFGLMCTSTLNLASPTNVVLDSIHFKINANNATSISCDATMQNCLATGSISKNKSINHVVYSTQNAGDSWNKPIRLHNSVIIPMDNTGYNIMKIRCDRAGMLCYVAGAMRTHTKEYIVVHTTYNGGITWNKKRFLRKQNSLSHVTGLACGENGEHCIIMGKDEGRSGSSFVYTTHDMGQTWSKSHLLPHATYRTAFDEAEDISCSASGLMCMIVGTMDRYIQNSYVITPISYVTTDGGLTWSEPQILDQKNTTTSTNGPALDFLA